MDKIMRSLLSVLAILLFSICCLCFCNEDGDTPFANSIWEGESTNVITPVRVVEYRPEEGVDSGFDDPDRALGLPKGSGSESGSTDVVSLGHDGDDADSKGGYIVLEFDRAIINGAGADFKVFENPFKYGESYYIESGIIYLSENGNTWEEFPNDLDPIYENDDIRHYVGLAGVAPVFSNQDDPDSPLPEDSDSGGDFFDLDDMPVTSPVRNNGFRFVRIVDAGKEIDDPGNSGPANSGFDLDAIVGINYE